MEVQLENSMRLHPALDVPPQSRNLCPVNGVRDSLYNSWEMGQLQHLV